MSVYGGRRARSRFVIVVGIGIGIGVGYRYNGSLHRKKKIFFFDILTWDVRVVL